MSRNKQKLHDRNTEIVAKFEKERDKNELRPSKIIEKLAEEYYLEEATIMNIIYRPNTWKLIEKSNSEQLKLL